MEPARNGVYVSFGRLFKTHTFETDNDANAFMESRSDCGLIGIDRDGIRHVAVKSDKGIELPRPRSLHCCCCGGYFTGRQFHNQDTGYGLGDCCVEYVKGRVEDSEHTYGQRGVHFDLGLYLNVVAERFGT